MSTKERKWFVRLGSKQPKEEEAVLHEDLKALTLAARRLVTNVIKLCEGKLESGIKQFLISSMSGDIMSENHQIDCHQVIYHVYHCAPHILSGVVPYLTGGLLTDQLETCLKAVSLVGDLSYLPGSTISEAFQPISPEFLKRLTDRVVYVRMLAVQHVKSCKLQPNPFRAEAPEIISALCDRLLDFYEKVRNQVVAVVYDVACHTLNSIPLKTIKQVAELLRDKSQGASCLFELESMQPFLNAIVKPESSSKVEKPLPFVSYAAAIGAEAAAEAMEAGFADPAGADPDDDEAVLTDEDDGDDLEGDADNEMEEEDDNGDDGNGGGVGVPVEIVGYGLHELVARIDLQQVPNAATLDQQVQDELVRHRLPNHIHPPEHYNIIYVVQHGLHQIDMTLQEMEDQFVWFLVPIFLRGIDAQPILNPRWIDVVIYHGPDRQVINQLDITQCQDADDLPLDLQVVLEQEFNIMEVEFHSTCIIDLPLHPNDERNLVEVSEIQPWIIAVQRILEIRVRIVNNGGPPSPGSGDSMVED